MTYEVHQIEIVLKPGAIQALFVPFQECNKILESMRNLGNPACKPFKTDSRKRSTFKVMLRFGG
jgi:hypothetical protein